MGSQEQRGNLVTKDYQALQVCQDMENLDFQDQKVTKDMMAFQELQGLKETKVRLVPQA